MKKLLFPFLLLSLIFSFGFSNQTFADENISTTDENVIYNDEVEVYKAPENIGASVDFIDETKVPKPTAIVPFGLITEKYSHSTYTYYSSSITKYNVGPRQNDKFLISVAKGQTKKLTHTVSVSGSVEVGGDNAIVKAVKLGLAGKVSGSITYTYDTSTSYSGPSKGDHRDYYGAIQYDLVQVKLKKYDVYNVYNGGIKTGTKTVYDKLVTSSNVKQPKAITYSKDFTE